MSAMTLGLSAAPIPTTTVRERQFFDVSVAKLIVMSIFTFGIYQAYWFYRNWQLAKERGDDVWPLARALFSPLFAFALFKEIQSTGRSAGVVAVTNASGLAWMYFLLQLTWRLPAPFGLIGVATVLPLVAVQRDVARVHQVLGFDPHVNDRFTWKNVIGIVVGSVLILMLLMAAMVTTPGPQ